MRRIDHDTVPPHVEYRLTEHGWTLGPIIEAMECWGEKHGASRARSAA